MANLFTSQQCQFFSVLTPELIEAALLKSRPSDIARFSQSCKAAYNLIYRSSDQFFWRQLYLTHWDDPRSSPTICSTSSDSLSSDFDWRSAVQRSVRAQHGILHRNADSKDIQALLDLVYSSATSGIEGIEVDSKNIEFLTGLLEDSDHRDYALCRSRFHTLLAVGKLNRQAASLSPDAAPLITAPVPSLLYSQTSAKLSCLCGFNIEERPLSFERGAARARVYDLSRYRVKTCYGPFIPAKDKDQAGMMVDWLQMEALMLVTASNALDLFGLEEMRNSFPMSVKAAAPFSAPRAKTKEDWAGVAGHWHRIICFLDYRDLFNYNIRRMNGQKDVNLDDYDEAVRLLHVELKISSYGSPDDHDPAFPTINFTGCSDGGRPHESKVFGTVKKLPSGDIRWNLISNYDGQDRWSSVGVQVGGQQSAAGVYGVWSGIDHEIEDPAGPFAFWKIKN